MLPTSPYHSTNLRQDYIATTNIYASNLPVSIHQPQAGRIATNLRQDTHSTNLRQDYISTNLRQDTHSTNLRQDYIATNLRQD